VTGQGPYRLRAGEVHLWRSTLTLPADELAELAECVSAAERERASQFHFAADRNRYLAGRAQLRRLLGRYLRADPATLPLAAGPHGKPYLADPEAGWLGFNLAHSGDLVVYAVAGDRDIGVDVEWVRPELDVDGLARRFFTAAERRWLDVLPRERRVSACVALWTRKEAVVKGLGLGLTLSPQRVEALPGRPGRVAAGDEAMIGPARWSVAAFSAGNGYRAAVALAGDALGLPRSAIPLSISD